MSIRRKLLRAVLWEPITWVPLAAATAIWTFVRLPWWSHVLTYGAAMGIAAASWGRMLPRLLALWETEEAEEKRAADAEAHRDFVAALRAAKLTDVAKQIETADALRDQVFALIKANPWLESFEYARNALRLCGDMEQTARTLLVPHQSRGGLTWQAKKDSIDASVAALQDTLETVEQTVKDTAAAAGGGGRSDLAAQVLKKNRITRQVLKDMNEPENPTPQ